MLNFAKLFPQLFSTTPRYVFLFVFILLTARAHAQFPRPLIEQTIPGTAVSFKMAVIPKGEFKMGSEKGEADEKPVRTVQLDGFFMSTTEVTWDLYELFLYKDYEVSQSSTAIRLRLIFFINL